ncbi:MAG: helix-turn-helix domain-containing protein [Ruminococcaceae bacterium]|nr:helix-turn-helix domain-containing protein [Oscillospiraceae bacterium]
MKNIKILRKESELSQAEFAALFNVHQTAVSQWEQGRTVPDIDTAIRIAEKFEVSLEFVLDKTDFRQESADTSKPSSGIKIPVYGKVAAGIPIDAIEDIIDYEELSEEMASHGEYIALQIKGDSMEPKISEGDVVIVRLQSDFNNGDTVIVLVNGDEATCKRIKKTPEGVMLISTNPNYEPMFYSKKEVEDLPVRVLGKVIELRAKF